jgi:hypothetical protein
MAVSVARASYLAPLTGDDERWTRIDGHAPVAHDFEDEFES